MTEEPGRGQRTPRRKVLWFAVSVQAPFAMGLTVAIGIIWSTIAFLGSPSLLGGAQQLRDPDLPGALGVVGYLVGGNALLPADAENILEDAALIWDVAQCSSCYNSDNRSNSGDSIFPFTTSISNCLFTIFRSVLRRRAGSVCFTRHSFAESPCRIFHCSNYSRYNASVAYSFSSVSLEGQRKIVECDLSKVN